MMERSLKGRTKKTLLGGEMEVVGEMSACTHITTNIRENNKGGTPQGKVQCQRKAKKHIQEGVINWMGWQQQQQQQKMPRTR